MIHQQVVISDIIIKKKLPINSRIRLINFSGCTDEFSFEQCKQQSVLHDYGLTNHSNVVLNAVNAIQTGLYIHITAHKMLYYINFTIYVYIQTCLNRINNI